jgi:hypothetical protein
MVCLAQTVHLSCTDTTLSSNRPKQDFTWPTSYRSTIWCIQNDFWAYGMFGTNRAPILRQDLHYLETDWNKPPLEPCHLGVPSVVSKTISEPMVHLVQTMHLSSLIVTLSPNELKQDSTWPTSLRSSIRCVQNDFWACNMFGANHTPILRQD